MVRKNNSVEEKCEKKRKGFEGPSKVTISDDVGKKKEKATATQKQINRNPIYYIKFKGTSQ